MAGLRCVNTAVASAVFPWGTVPMQHLSARVPSFLRAQGENEGSRATSRRLVRDLGRCRAEEAESRRISISCCQRPYHRYHTSR